ncbi:MAG: hypothetical protein NTY53_18375 [Kiritimatiellaeota bacterium]|nr:hypothetical protein [Kiritimatiellota bacterium]
MNGGILPLIMVGLVVLLPLLWVIGTFNGLIRLRNQCRESWAGIDTELKRRYDLIPRLATRSTSATYSNASSRRAPPPSPQPVRPPVRRRTRRSSSARCGISLGWWSAIPT